MIVVSALALTPVKGTRLRRVDAIDLTPTGARGDRQFFVIDRRDRMLNGKQLGELNTIVSSFAPEERRLTLTFPQGREISGEVRAGAPVAARFYSRRLEGSIVEGPWAAAISEYVGQPLRLVQAEGAVDRGSRGAASLISRASLGRLAAQAGEPAVDPRRFRMLVEVDGVQAHAEDAWVGRKVRIGAALVRFGGHVGRCLITSRHPETGEIDLATLDLLGSYRRDLDTTEPLPFGIYGEVVQAGAVRVGDPVLAEG